MHGERRSIKGKLKTLDSRRTMVNTNTRVVQTNLMFVSGIPLRIADPELLKRPDYFGKFGKIHRIIFNMAPQVIPLHQ